MKLNLLALPTAAHLMADAHAFVPATPPAAARAGRRATALRDYTTKWSPRSTSPSPSSCPHAGAVANKYARTKWSPSSPGGGGGAAAAAVPTTGPVLAAGDHTAVRAELRRLMDNPSWDDGSLAPLLLRLAWHSSGTYDAATGTGGSNGAGMRFENEAADPENAGLMAARAFLEPVKQMFPDVSYSDLWILASYVGLEATGGPVLEFRGGRVDHPDDAYFRDNMEYGRLPAAEKYCCPHLDDAAAAASLDPATGAVRGWEGLCDHVRSEVFYRMGFDDREIVALLCGGHVYGRCHPTASGYAGPWVEHPTEFSNEYASDMIEDEWTLVRTFGRGGGARDRVSEPRRGGSAARSAGRDLRVARLLSLTPTAAASVFR